MTTWCVNGWFEFFGGFSKCQNPWYMRGTCDNKEGDLNWAHSCPRVLGNMREEVTLHGVKLWRLGCIPIFVRLIANPRKWYIQGSTSKASKMKRPWFDNTLLPNLDGSNSRKYVHLICEVNLQVWIQSWVWKQHPWRGVFGRKGS